MSSLRYVVKNSAVLMCLKKCVVKILLCTLVHIVSNFCMSEDQVLILFSRMYFLK